MEQAVYFHNNQGEKLAGTLHRPEQPSDAGIILGHCFTCSRHTSVLRDIARHLNGKGITTLRFDFSGNGQSEGDFAQTSYTKHIREMKAAADFLAGQGVVRFGLAGHSMGAAIAMLAASVIRDVRAVCTLAGRLGGSDATKLFTREQMARLEKTGTVSFTSRGRNLALSENFFSDLRRYNLPETVAECKVPLLVVHGDRDEIIPAENARQAKTLNPATELVIIPGADHMFMNPEHRAQIAKRVAGWFERHMA
ncbi:osmotically inducible protein C [Desulfonema ishimotonii]|uniref:Osmotically inducible protein C n=2 Tax=Desulfonema ishimotonii TaxID=45657 RepID=A0A401FVR4_9BACT|nr:osmotically inducible protein C [Desulfonema ishimotonii]